MRQGAACRRRSGHGGLLFPTQRTNNCGTRVQPLANTTCGALCASLHRSSLRVQCVFNLPMTKLIGITQSAPGDWKLTELGWIFSLAIFFLGTSAAAVLGRWVEEGGPRRAMFTAGLCWAGGFFLSAIGVYLHQLWIVYVGYGVLGGIGLGTGYISPVSTLIRWFPDRPGMATGMAIMGFGGGAFIASPLS